MLEQNLETAAEELASRERDAAHEHSAHENQLRAQESLLESQRVELHVERRTYEKDHRAMHKSMLVGQPRLDRCSLASIHFLSHSILRL